MGPKPGGTYVDATLGAGGHAKAILQKMGAGGKLVAIEKDARAIKTAQETLRSFGDSVMIIHDDFRNIAKVMDAAGIREIDGMVADLGVSSMQLDEPERGFSFRGDGPLDMRMDPSGALTAEKIINTASEKELADILYQFGEERFSRRIAKAIVQARHSEPLRTTSDLVSVILRAVPAGYRHGRIHAATRSFQALRIAVNDEMGALQVFLNDAVKFLAPKGRLIVISFHSLEDRAVKTRFRELKKAGIGRVLTPKPVTASEDEIQDNPRARSAKLRVFEK